MALAAAQAGASNIWSLEEASLQNDAVQLNSVINQKSDLMNAGLNADCDTFGAKNICLSVNGGYYSANETQQATRGDAGVKFAYKFSDMLRAGLMLDWGISESNPSDFSNSNSPMGGVFAVWGHDTGSMIKVSVVGNREDAQITHQYDIGVSAPNPHADGFLDNRIQNASGDTNINSYALQAEYAYGMELHGYNVSPFAGIRRASVNRVGYGESSGTDWPMTFSDTGFSATTILVGANACGKVYKSVGIKAGAGVGYDIAETMDGYSANYANGNEIYTVAGSDENKFRAFGSLGAYYDLTNGSKIAAGVAIAKEPLQNATGTTWNASYTIGF
jgi:hypothetical protein